MPGTMVEIPEGCKIIRDVMPLKILDSKMLTEEVGGKKSNMLRLTGIFQKADEKNANGRIYPMEVLKKAVADLQESIGFRRVMGEFDHPPDAKIHLENVSHLVTKVWMDKNICYGQIEVLDRMPKGQMLRSLIESKVQVGISSRGIGDMEAKKINEEECYEVQPGFALVTWDAVAEPSVSGTQLTVLESLMRKKKNVKTITAKQLTERSVITVIHNFLSE